MRHRYAGPTTRPGLGLHVIRRVPSERDRQSLRDKPPVDVDEVYGTNRKQPPVGIPVSAFANHQAAVDIVGKRIGGALDPLEILDELMAIEREIMEELEELRDATRDLVQP